MSRNIASKLLLVGAGHLGSRYLQGLVSASYELDITVVDTSAISLLTAKSRWIEAGGNESQHQVRWLESLPSELVQVDIALVVTSSRGRASLIETIANKIEVRFWVLEKVLTQSRNELSVINSVLAGHGGAWVNIPRRMMPWYQSLKKIFARHGVHEVSYSAGVWGLASNSIHFIDLVAWWCSERPLSVKTNGLHKVWFESKRCPH